MRYRKRERKREKTKEGEERKKERKKGCLLKVAPFIILCEVIQVGIPQ